MLLTAKRAFLYGVGLTLFLGIQTACSPATLIPTYIPDIATVPGTQAPTPTPVSTPTPTGLFVKYTTGPIVNSGKMSRGMAWGDYNKDGYPDLFVANSQWQTNFLYRNEGDGTFTPLEESEIMQVKSNSESGNWVDYDNDGDLDLFVTNIRNEPNFLYRNDGGDSFTRVMEGEIVSEKLASTGSCWADYDNDGDLDVVVTNRDGQDNSMFSNNGDGSFTKVTTGAIVTDDGDSRACGWADVDGDTDLDLYVGNAHETNFFYTNNGDGTFARDLAQSFVKHAGYTYGLSWADIDNDGDIDLFVANMQEKNELYLNNGFGEFERIDYEPFNEDIGASKGNTWGDFDNDGDLDLFIANGTPDISDVTNYLYLNQGNGQFTRESIGALTDDNHISSGTAWADYNRDGRLDIFVSNWADNDQNNALYTNENSDAGNWVRISLAGNESNRSAIGTTVRLEAMIDGKTVWQTRQVLGNTGYGSQNEQLIHFGVGEALQIDSLEIYWPSGIVDSYKKLSVNKIHNFMEGSSPGQDIQGASNTIGQAINEGYGNYLLVPAGQFSMGDHYDEGSYDNGIPRERPVHTVYLDAFYIGEFEITNAEYGKFIEDGGYENREYWERGGFQAATRPSHWDTEDYNGGGIPGNENFPVVGVSWAAAPSYMIHSSSVALIAVPITFHSAGNILVSAVFV